MADTTVQISGLRETVRSLERFGVSVADLKASFRRIGELGVDEARVLAPHRSGDLAASVRAANAKNRATIRAGSARVPYAGVIHYGGYNNIDPQPFLESAVDTIQHTAVRMLDSELRGLIRKYDLT